MQQQSYCINSVLSDYILAKIIVCYYVLKVIFI